MTEALAKTGVIGAPRLSAASLGYLFALAGAVLFSTKSIFIKMAYAVGSDAEALLALRMLIALPIYLLIWCFQRRAAPVLWTSGTAAAAAIGILGYALSSYLDLKGLEYVSAPVERLILFTYPFFTAIIGAALFGERLRWASMVGLVVSYLGLCIVMLDYVDQTTRLQALGFFLVFGSAVTFALYQLLAGRSVKAIGAVQFTCVSMSAAAVASLVSFAVQRPLLTLFPSGQIFLLAAALAILGTVLPSFALSAALKRISAQANSAVGAVSPVVTILLSVWILGEQLTPRVIVGGSLVVLGTLWFTSRQRSNAGDKPTP